jgi:hypothetical protein
MTLKHSVTRRLDIYSELCPASSATIIGAGLVSITLGSLVGGIACVLAGVGVGIAGPIIKTIQEKHNIRKR